MSESASRAVASSSGAPTASRQIAEHLLRRIIADDFAAGERLPTERELAVAYGVNRHVVREALTRLEAIGIIEIRRGSGIYVQDLQLTGGLEMFDLLMTRPDGGVNQQFLEDALDFRDAIYRNVVKLAARNRSPRDVADLKKAVSERRNSLDDLEKLMAIDFRLLRLLAVAAHNQVYTLFFNTMSKLIPKMHDLLTWKRLDQERFQLTSERMCEAIEHREAEMADLLAARLMDMIREATLRPAPRASRTEENAQERDLAGSLD